MAGSIQLSRVFYTVLLASIFLGGLTACDSFTESSSNEMERPSASALTFSHMPTGAVLPSPDEVSLERGMVRPDQEPTRRAQPRLPRSNTSCLG